MGEIGELQNPIPQGNAASADPYGSTSIVKPFGGKDVEEKSLV